MQTNRKFMFSEQVVSNKSFVLSKNRVYLKYTNKIL